MCNKILNSKILQLNIGRNKLDMECLNDGIDILLTQEPSLNSRINNKIKTYQNGVDNSIKTEISVLNAQLNFLLLDEFPNNNICTILAKINFKIFVISSVYIQPSCDDLGISEIINQILKKFNQAAFITLAGDINAKGHIWQNKHFNHTGEILHEILNL